MEQKQEKQREPQTGGRRQRRRARGREDRIRQEALAATILPASAPLVWGAGTGCRLLAAGWLGHLVFFGPLRRGVDVAELGPPDLFFRLWALAVAVWIFCRLCAWKVTADRDGVTISRFVTVDRVPWDELGRAVPRQDGCVGVAGRLTGPFLPPPLARLLRRPVTARAMADRLTVTARLPELRPTEEADTRTRARPYALWAPLPLLVIAAAHLFTR